MICRRQVLKFLNCDPSGHPPPSSVASPFVPKHLRVRKVGRPEGIQPFEHTTTHLAMGSVHHNHPSLSETVLREGVSQSLRSHLSDNAIFLAERLCVSHPSPSASHLLASAHLQAGNFSRAANSLKPPTTPANRYLYALACFKIGSPAHLREAEQALRAPGPRAVPGGAAGQYLLGAICQQTTRKEAAIEHYQRALRANPTLWLAFDALAKLGLGPSKVDAVFGHATDAAARELMGMQPFASARTHAPAHGGPPPPHQAISPEPPAPAAAPAPRRRLRSFNNALRSASTPTDAPTVPPLPAGGFDTPANGNYVTPSPSGGGRGTFDEPPAHHMPMRVTKGVLRRTSRSGRASAQSPDGPHDFPSKLFGTPSATDTAPTPRKKSSLRRKLGEAAGVGGGSSSTSVSEVSAALTVHDPRGVSWDLARAPPPAPAAGPGAMEVLRALGKLRAALGRYQCDQAHKLLDALPAPHATSAVALSARARARFEEGDFAGACAEYKRALAADPTCLDAIVERYSTALWHQKEGVDLALLAARAQETYPPTSAGWVAVGNAYSLQADADAALRFFRKATALDPQNAYAHTLVGHELVVKEDFDGALAAFRAALHLDERHYNALYGIAQVLQRQEKYLLSERHFRAALNIHPRNYFLHYHLGQALAARAHHDFAKANARAQAGGVLSPPPADLAPALEQLEKACALNPKNPVAAFEKARVLIAIGRLSEARGLLVKLRDVMPKEAEVHYEVARLDRQLGDLKSAVSAIMVALNLDPKERKYKKELEVLNVKTSEFHFAAAV